MNIAGGIILAVLFFAFLPLILIAGFYLAIFALCILAFYLIILFIKSYPILALGLIIIWGFFYYLSVKIVPTEIKQEKK